MKIAVIDEGVLPVFNKELNIIENLMVSSENLVINTSDDVLISTDHGFNVCKIINKYAPEAEIISIRISNSTEVNANIKALITAFKYCFDNNISIIHFSGGSVNLKDDYLLRDIIKDIINNDQIIIAAHSNSKGLSFPAVYPYVFSVRASELFNEYEDNLCWGYNFVMPSKHRININEDINYITQSANSYAAPVLTAKIYNMLKFKNNNSCILEGLGISDKIFLCEHPIFLEDVTIINIDNEIIVEEILPFKVRKIYSDIRFKADTRDYVFIPNKNKEYTIEKFSSFLELLPKKEDRIRIVYLGTIDKEIKEIITSYKFDFWFIPNDEIYPIDVPNTVLNNFATIYFQGNKEVVYYIMAGLRDAFLEDGYNCFSISNYIDATLYYIYYFKDIGKSYRRKQLEYILEPDVELVYSKDESFKEIEDSMTIEVTKDDDIIKLKISTLDMNEELNICGKVDFKILLDKIVDMV